MRSDSRCAIVLLALPFLFACSAPDAVPLPDVFLAGVPNLSQSGGGFNEEHYAPEQLCAPVAVSNSLVWLEGRGHLNGKRSGDGAGQQNDEQADQHALVNKLAQIRYMTTSPSVGTSPTGVIRGVTRHLSERDVVPLYLSYVGLRDVSAEFVAKEQLSQSWLHEGLNHNSAIWVNFGWYREVLPGVHRRLGGHWMTLVGFVDGELVLHDPAEGSVVSMPVTVRPWGLLHLASWGLYEDILEVPARLAHRGDYALIDGAVKLELPPKNGGRIE